MTKSVESKALVKGIGSKCVLKEYAQNNYYAWFYTCSNHSFREMHFNATQPKSRPRALRHNVSKSMSRAITLQDLTLAAITASENTL